MSSNKSRNAKRVTLALAGVFSVALFASVVGAYSLVQKKRAEAGPKTQDTRQRAKYVRSAAEKWLSEKGADTCPGMRELVEAGYLESPQRAVDGWEHPFRLECAGGAVAAVISAGADGLFGEVKGVSDDLRD